MSEFKKNYLLRHAIENRKYNLSNFFSLYPLCMHFTYFGYEEHVL